MVASIIFPVIFLMIRESKWIRITQKNNKLTNFQSKIVWCRSSMRLGPSITPSKSDVDNDVITLMEKYKEKVEKTLTIIPFGSVYKDISEKGIRVFQDERLKNSCKELPKYSESLCPSSISLSLDQFKRFILATKSFLMTVFKDELILPKFNLFETEMSFLCEACRCIDSGKVYEGVPHLKKLDPNLWQMGFCSIDGQVHLSDPENLQPFPIMGMSKLFLYSLAIDLLGLDVVHAYVGLYTTRKSGLEKECAPQSTKSFKKPVNPHTECGAMVLSSLLYNVALKDLSLSEKYDYVHSYIKELAGGGHFGTDKAIFMSMKDNDSEYISLCYYLESCKAFKWPHNVIRDLEFYLQICSFEANIESLSIIGATIANDGVSPFTMKRIIKKGYCKYLYNYMMLYSTGAASALWVRKVGLPVVFGESGCCLLIVPGLMAWSFISPNLDEFSFSSKAYKYIQSVCDLYFLHPFESITEPEEKNVICPFLCSMFKIVGNADVFMVISLIQMGMRPCSKDYFDETILHYAAAAGNLKFVEFIVRLCPHLLLKKDLLGNTASQVAAFFGHEKIVTYLEMKENQIKNSYSRSVYRGKGSTIGKIK